MRRDKALERVNREPPSWFPYLVVFVAGTFFGVAVGLSWAINVRSR